MVSKSKGKQLKIIAILSIIVMIIGLMVGKIYSTSDNHYVLDVVKEKAETKDDNLQVTEKIVKEGKYFDSHELNYEVEIKNISQAENVETQIAIVVDSSYSMQVNDISDVVKTNAKKFVSEILDNVDKARISISNNSSIKENMSNYNTKINTNKNTINSRIDGLVYGDGNDSNNGLDNAVKSFQTPLKSTDVVNKYIVVFTDSTDDVSDKMKEIVKNDSSIKIISILLDMTSDSYIIDDKAVCGDVYLLLSEIEESDITNKVQLFDSSKICNEMNRRMSNVEVTNEFSNEILTYFDIDFEKPEKGTIVQTKTGYTWKIDEIDKLDIVKLQYKLTLKTKNDIDASVIFNEIYTNKTQNIKYTTYESTEKTLAGTDEREGTESTVIKICQGYDLKIKAVNESNTELPVEGVQFTVIGTKINDDDTTEEVCNLIKTTDSDGYIIITSDEARALRMDGEIEYTITPSIDLIGYTTTDSIQFLVNNDKITRKLKIDDYKNDKITTNVDEDKRLINVEIPINSQRIDFELKVEELNNSSVTISDAEFELIQPKLNNKYEMDVLTGKTDKNGIIHFAPTVMTKNGTYNYILRQVNSSDGYEVTSLTLITIEFKNGKIISKPGIQFNPNAKSELLTDKENHILITIGNENVEQDPFDIQINLSDINSGDKLEGVTYLITTTNAKGQVRNEYATTDENGQINTKIYGNGNLNIKITEQSPKVGYVADTKTKEIIINRNNGEVIIWHSDATTTQSASKDDIIVNLYSQKKAEQNIVHVTLVDAEEQDVSVGTGVVYRLLDTETGKQYGPSVSNKKGELSFVIDTKEQGQHKFQLVVDEDFIPEEYDETSIDKNINFNLIFDNTGYIKEVNVIDDSTVIDNHYSTVNNNESVEYTAFITIGYQLNKSNIVEFKVQLKDYNDLTTSIEGAAYNIEIEWDIDGITRTKTINSRRTNAKGEITTYIFKGEQVRIFVTEVGAAVGYGIDHTTQEIYLTFNNSGAITITQTPYDLGKTNTEEPNQGAYEKNETVIYKHLNKKKTTEDTYVNLTINKIDMNGAYVSGIPVYIKSSTLLDKNDGALELIKKTDEQGTITIDYREYIQDIIEKQTIRVPGIIDDSEEMFYDLEISEAQVDKESESGYSIKNGTTVKLRLIFRYKDGEVTLTNVETIYGNRLVKNKIFSSGSDSIEGKTEEDTLGVYLSNISLDLYTNYDDIGNLSFDLKKQNGDGELLAGAIYKLKITNPDGTVIRKEININNGDESSDIEISGVTVNVGSLIELTEITAPVGYGVNSSTEILEVVEISDDGEITLEHKEPSYEPSRLVVEKQASTLTTSGNLKTNYTISFIDYQLDVFEFGIATKDKETNKGVEGFKFKIDTSKGATKTLQTNSYGYGTTKVGGNIENSVITYTISATKLADYYKPLENLINVNVVFDEFGNVDIDATKTAQTDLGFGSIWTITELETYGKIGIQILVEHQEPLVVKIETIDKITNSKIKDVSYKITESEELPAIGSDTIEIGYALQDGIRTYTISQLNIKNSYSDIADKIFTVTYANAVLTETSIISTKTEDAIKITGDKEVTITIYVEPKLPFEITNLYYFNTDIKLQGSHFEIVSLKNKDTGSGITDANGMTAIYSDILGTNEEVIYRISQKQGTIGYATVEDFYVKVTYNENREITNAKLVDQYGSEITNNRFVTVGFIKTSLNYEHNSNDKGIVTLQVLNYPEFKMLIENVDRRDGITPIEGTEYKIKSIYTESDGTIVDFTNADGVITDINGIGTAHLDKTKDNTVVTYTLFETTPGVGYQSLGTEINVIVTFDGNGYVSNVEVENNSNLSKIEYASKIEPVINPEDNFIVKLQLKNNPILKFNLTAMDSKDHNVKIKDLGFQIESKIGEETYAYSSATNSVNQSGSPETSYTDINGYTASYLDRTLDNKDMYYTIKQVQKVPGYEWADKDIIIKVTYDSNGKISTITSVEGGELINIKSYDSENFEINIDIYNDEIKEFGIHLSAVDTYDVNKKLNNMKVEAFLVEPGNTSYVSDGKYELVRENALLTGEDKDGDGKPDLTYGEDYKKIGAFKEISEGEVTRTLRLVIKNDSIETSTSGSATTKSGYYLDSTDDSKSGNNVGYYKGATYYGDAEYQIVKYEYLIDVTFDSDGKIKLAKLNTGLNTHIGWLTDDRYIQVDEKGNLEHTDYRLNITMKFFPMFDLNLNAMDNYTYLDEIESNGKPIALAGSKYTISTTRDYAYTQKDEYVTAGYIGYPKYYGLSSGTVYGDIYEDTDRLLIPIEKNHSRLFYIYEEKEPTNYQKTNPRLLTHYTQRLVAIIQVTFDEYGEIDYDKSILRKVNDDATEYTIKPYLDESGRDYLSSNNIPEYNYWYNHESANRDINFYIGYALTTKINVTAIDDISGNPISNIRMYPFIHNNCDEHDTYGTQLSYAYNIYSYRDTDSNGQFSIKYWGAATQNRLNQYIIGSSRIGNSYNGYFFPSDMADKILGGSGNEEDYYAILDITYGDDGKISNVQSIGTDLWGDNNVANITWDSKTGNVYINMLYSRKFQVTLNKTDFYDSTINNLKATFDVISNKGLTTSIDAKKMTPLGKIYKDTTVKYTLSETEVPEGYYPISEPIDFYVTFDKNGNIGTKTVKSSSKYFETVTTTSNTERINKGTPDLTINIKNKPAFNLDLRIIDKFYKEDGIKDIYLQVTNSKGDTALGNPQTDKNGYSQVITGPVYPGETVKYYISQTNTAPGYYQNATIIELEVKFNNVGKIEDYKIISGNEVINEFDPASYMNTRTITMNIMNMPKDLKIGLYKYDKTTNLPMSGVQFTVTKEDMKSGATSQTTIISNDDGSVIENIDIFSTSLDGKVIKYTIHEDDTPASYRTMEDIVFLIRYNADGSIASVNQLSGRVTPQIAIGKIKYLNDTRVHFKFEVPNDNSFDIIIKNEDTNYAGLGIEGSQFDVSINGFTYTPRPTDPKEIVDVPASQIVELTDINGKTTLKDITLSGDITINISQKAVGEGYRFDPDNNVQIQLEKGTTIYSLDLKTTTPGFVDDKNATTTKAIVEVDEIHGTITVTFKNETKTELTLFKQDVNSKIALKGAEFEIIAQQIDSTGNNIGDSIILTTEDNKITNVNGQLYFELGVAPQSQIWTYTFKEITPPEGYNPIVDLVMTVTYDQYGRISSQETNKSSRLKPTMETENYNCHSIYAIIYNGDVSPAYKVKVVTEDVDTGKRINGSKIYINITDDKGNLIKVKPITIASAENGRISTTANLGIDGLMYSDSALDAENSSAPIIVEKGLTYIDNIDYEGILNIEVSQKETADGYIFGKQKTDGNIKINAKYIPQLDDDPTAEFTVLENDGFDIIVDNVNREITIKILNESQVLFDITTKQYSSNTSSEIKYIQGVNYNITSEIQTAVDSIITDLNETTTLSDENGKTKGNVGTAYAGKTVVYTLHQNIVPGYKTIEDIQIEVKYDSKGNIKFYEILSSEDNCYIDTENSTNRTIALVVQNRKELSGYKVSVEKHAMDTDDDELAYSKLLEGAKFKITVNQEDSGVENTTWIDTTDENGYIDGLVFNGFGYITIILEELEAPDGYEIDSLRKLRIYRDINTGEISEIDGDINFTHNEDFTEVCLKPVDNQSNDKFTLIINKYSTATNKYITDSQAEFKAELIKKDIDGNIVYKDTIDYIYTNKYGKAIMDNQNMPGEEGEYKLVITELKAPEGYVGLTENIEIPITFIKDTTGNIVIDSINVDGLENISISKINKQLIGINIGNNVKEEIKDDEYSLDITKVDGKTGNPIEDMAIFKVLIPDDNNTSVYTETMETLLGKGKLDYCYIEQDKDYQVRLTHMKLPSGEAILKYVFKEIVAPKGYSIINEDLELTIEFKIDSTTGKMYIAKAISSNEDYLRINTVTPCPTNTSLSIDILNYNEEQTEFTVHYNANDDGEGTIIPDDQIKEKDIDLELDKMIPTRKGYIFKGWGLLPTSTIVEFNPGDIYSINDDITLYAIWEENKYTITYYNTKDCDNSANPTTYTIKTPDITLVDLPNLPKYKFKGWYTSNDETGVKITSIDTSKLENIVLYAQWENDDLYYKSEKYKVGENNIDIYEDGDIYLDKIEPETTVKELIENSDTNGIITVIDAMGNELKEDDFVGTGMTIKITKDDEEINMTAVVMGDLDGNGKVTATDLSTLNKVILKVITLEGAEFKAADLDDSGRLTATDLSTINNVILKNITLTYSKPKTKEEI